MKAKKTQRMDCIMKPNQSKKNKKWMSSTKDVNKIIWGVGGSPSLKGKGLNFRNFAQTMIFDNLRGNNQWMAWYLDCGNDVFLSHFNSHYYFVYENRTCNDVDGPCVEFSWLDGDTFIEMRREVILRCIMCYMKYHLLILVKMNIKSRYFSLFLNILKYLLMNFNNFYIISRFLQKFLFIIYLYIL